LPQNVVLNTRLCFDRLLQFLIGFHQFQLIALLLAQQAKLQ